MKQGYLTERTYHKAGLGTSKSRDVIFTYLASQLSFLTNGVEQQAATVGEF